MMARTLLSSTFILALTIISALQATAAPVPMSVPNSNSNTELGPHNRLPRSVVRLLMQDTRSHTLSRPERTHCLSLPVPIRTKKPRLSPLHPLARSALHAPPALQYASLYPSHFHSFALAPSRSLSHSPASLSGLPPSRSVRPPWPLQPSTVHVVRGLRWQGRWVDTVTRRAGDVSTHYFFV